MPSSAMVVCFATFVCFWSVQFVSASKERRNIFVIPYNTPPSNCPAKQCYDLHEVSNMSDHFFSSNTTIALMEGTHVFNNLNKTDVVIEEVENFELTAANITAGVTIKCHTSFALYFRFTRNLTISGITFEDCGADIINFNNSAVSATLCILISCNVVIYNITISKGRGFGLLVYNFHRRFSIQNSNFIQNQLNVGLFKLPFSINNFQCPTSKLRQIEIVRSKFIGGYVNPNGSENNYHDYSSGITIITFSLHDPSLTKTKVILYEVIVHNNTGRTGNLYIEYNACITEVQIHYLNSCNSSTGIFLRPRLWRSTYCTVYTAWGISTISESSFSNTSLYFSVLKEEVPDIDDLLDTQDPELNYLHVIALYNVTVMNSEANITLYIVYVHRVIMMDVTFENNSGEDLIRLIEMEVLLQGECIFRKNIGGIAVYFGSRLVFSKDSDVQVLDTHDGINAPLHVSYAYVEMQTNSKIIFRNNSGQHLNLLSL